MTPKPWIKWSRDLSTKDKRLGKLIKRVGPPKISLEKDYFRALTEAILSQQLAGKAASTIIKRFTELSTSYPKPSQILRWAEEKDPTRMRKAGVSSQKSSYLVSLSTHWANRTWRKDWEKLSDEQLIERLTEVKGIGVWTAQMFLIFSLGRPNVLPVLDYGVRRGLMVLYGLPEIPHPKEVPALVPHWDGGYSIGSWYMWRAVDEKSS